MSAVQVVSAYTDHSGLANKCQLCWPRQREQGISRLGWLQCTEISAWPWIMPVQLFLSWLGWGKDYTVDKRLPSRTPFRHQRVRQLFGAYMLQDSWTSNNTGITKPAIDMHRCFKEDMEMKRFLTVTHGRQEGRVWAHLDRPDLLVKTDRQRAC